ncbi:MAG: DUF4190 domain-containing protein [Pyrinomonadaceae bacterium]
MKKCPTCQKTFDDNLKFCQSDGTLLVEDAPPPDPYATMVASKDELMSAMPDAPKDTPSASVAEADDDLLDIPDDSDANKTMFVTDAERKGMFDEPSSTPIPPPSFGNDDLLEDHQSSNTADTLLAQPEPPKFNEPDLNPPSFGDSPPPFSGSSSTPGSPFDNEPPSFDKQPLPGDFDAPKKSDENPFNTPIPSPFGEQMPPSYNAPSTPPFEPLDFKVEEVKAEALNTPFAEDVAQSNQQIAEQSWTPPAAPEQSWQDQEIGQNTPFQPPPAGQSLNQTLPIVSLVLGILSLCCYVSPLTGIAALITGFLGMKNANNDPAHYGGKTLAIVGMILGGLFFLVGVVYYIFWLIIGLPNLMR